MDLEKLIPIHPQRKRTYENFLKLLKQYIHNKNKDNYTENDIIKMSLNIERGIFNKSIVLYSNTCKDTWNDVFNNIYVNKSVQLYNNLNPDSDIP